MNRSELAARLEVLLRQSPDSTARELAWALRRQGYMVSKRHINPILYGESETFGRSGMPPRWRLIAAASRGDGTGLLPDVAVLVPTQHPRGEALTSFPGSGSEDGRPRRPSPDVAEVFAADDRSVGLVEPPELLPWFLALRPWQQEAMLSWQDAGRRSTIEAVTGTGKSHVGLEAIAQVCQQGGVAAVLVPTVLLQKQWLDLIERELPGLEAEAVGGVWTSHTPWRHAQVVVATASTAANLPLVPPHSPALVVADEAHRFGAPKWSAALSPAYDYRLGLTATLERSADNAVEEVLLPYLGAQSLIYTYDRAIPEEVVAPFSVALLGVELTGDERERYESMTHTIGKLRPQLEAAGARSGKEFFADVSRIASSTDRARVTARRFQKLTRDRLKLLLSCDGKAVALSELAPVVAEHRGAVVFTQNTDMAEDGTTYLTEQGVQADFIHSDDGRSEQERAALISDLKDGTLQALCAPKILDEGIDLPHVDLGVVLGASRTRRQMIQRLGRVIRKKADGRHAHFIIVYAIGTVEDPDEGSVDEFVGLVEDASQATVVMQDWTADDVIQWFRSSDSQHRAPPRKRQSPEHAVPDQIAEPGDDQGLPQPDSSVRPEDIHSQTPTVPLVQLARDVERILTSTERVLGLAGYGPHRAPDGGLTAVTGQGTVDTAALRHRLTESAIRVALEHDPSLAGDDRISTEKLRAQVATLVAAATLQLERSDAQDASKAASTVESSAEGTITDTHTRNQQVPNQKATGTTTDVEGRIGTPEHTIPAAFARAGTEPRPGELFLSRRGVAFVAGGTTMHVLWDRVSVIRVGPQLVQIGSARVRPDHREDTETILRFALQSRPAAVRQDGAAGGGDSSQGPASSSVLNGA